jgi:hypothetical protein
MVPGESEKQRRKRIEYMEVVSSVRNPLVTGAKTVADVTQDICVRVEAKPPKTWFLAIAVSLSLLLIGTYTLYKTLWDGIGVWGLE